MELKTSCQWFDLYTRWGGTVVIYDPDGWDRRHWHHSWFEERISAEEFYRRAMRSTIVPFRKSFDLSWPMDDLSYFFTVVCRDGSDER